MRWVVAAAVTMACLAGAALAQNDPLPTIQVTPQFVALPTGADYARNYPERALRRGVAGMAVLCCAVDADRHLNCQARYEMPADEGFGRASEEVARSFVMSESAYAEHQSAPQLIQRTIVWRAGHNSRRSDDALREASEATRNLCAAAPPPA